MNVIVANASKNQAYHTALAAQRAGYLKFLLTTVYYKPGSFSGKLLSLGLAQARRLNRNLPELQLDKVRSFWWAEAAARLAKKTPAIGGRRLPWYYIQNVLFDYWAARYAAESDIFHGFDGCSLLSNRRAKMAGASCILDLKIMHPVVANAIMEEEWNRFHVPPGHYADLLIPRTCAEIAMADRVLVGSQTVFDGCVQAGVEKSKLVLVPYGYDQRVYKPSSKSDDCFRILFAGTLQLRKGLPYLLEAYRQLRLPDSELLLIGAPTPEILPLLKEYAGTYRHIDHVPELELHTYFSNASVFVLPSLVEGSALVTYGAMACGLPLVVSENAGSIARDGQDGFVVPIRDVEALQDRISQLYTNERLRKEMGRSALEYVRNFTWETYYDRVAQVYETLSNWVAAEHR